MDDKDDAGQPFDWAIEVERVEFPGELPPDTFCAKVIDALDFPELPAAAAVVKLVKLPKTYELPPDTCFAEIMELPKRVKLPPGTVLVKASGTPGVPSAPQGAVIIDAYATPWGVPDGGPKTLGIRVPPFRGGVSRGKGGQGFVPIIPPGFKGGR